MYRAVLKLLLGLTLSLGGGASAIGMPHDDETVCSRATSGAPPVWSSINLLYVEEAVKRGLTCGVGNTTNASLSERTFNQKQILMANEFIDANKDIFQSSQIVKIQLLGDFKGKKGSYRTTYHGFATANEIFVSSSWGRGFKVIYGSADTKSKTQVLKGWDIIKKPKKGKASISFKSKTNGSFFEILADGHFSGFKNWSTRVPGKLQLARPINVFLQKRTVSGLRNTVSAQGADSVRREVTRRIKLFRELEKTRKKYEQRAKENGVFSPNFGKNNTKVIAQLLELEEQLRGLSEQFKTQMANLEPVPKKLGVAEVQVPKIDTLCDVCSAEMMQEETSEKVIKTAKTSQSGAAASINSENINHKDEIETEEAKDLRLAKLEEERKAQKAEARRLARLEKERKAKEAEARRLAKLEEERKAKEAEARRLAKIEEERKAREAEARRLAKLEEERKAKEAEARRLAEADKSPPQIFAEVVSQDGYDALIRGVITDDTGLQDMAMNGQLLEVDEQGVFETSVYIPRGGALLVIEALDKMGKLSRFELPLERKQVAKLQLASFEKLSPSNRRAKLNQNAVAVIIGVAEYQRTEVPAVYADEDAKFFYDYATLKLGVPEQNIIELVNDKANEIEIALAIENFLKRRIKRNQTDVYIFFAGHGLATDDGSEMYLLPYDGAPQLLERTAISRKQLFNDIAASNPKSVTVFLDTCYSGTTRGTETLIASRPIAIKARQQDIPEGFTVMTAAAGDQTAKPLEEARHGMFSYFLMKGMEGDADANQDNQITAGELHAYVQQNVIQQSSGSQTPQLQGDADRVLVRFQ